MEYLDFELPIKELEDQLDKCLVIGQESDVDVSNTCKQITNKLEETKKSIYKRGNNCLKCLDQNFQEKKLSGWL